MLFKYIKHIEIDKEKWDRCITHSVNGLIYANSWYLDIICENWDAIILGDYEAVLPLPWKRILGIKYIYHPFFSQQLGVFHKAGSSNILSEFIKHIPYYFVKYHFSCNYMNNIIGLVPNNRVNYVLNIDKSYDELFKLFSKNTKRNIKKGSANSIDIKYDTPINDFILLTKHNNISKLGDTHINILHKLFNTLTNKKYAKTVGAYDNEGALVGAAFVVEFKNRITYLFAVSSDSGKQNSVMFAIVNDIIKNNINTGKIIDFEGSMIEGVARFYKGFGADIENYYHINKSKIPFLK